MHSPLHINYLGREYEQERRRGPKTKSWGTPSFIWVEKQRLEKETNEVGMSQKPKCLRKRAKMKASEWLCMMKTER